MRSKYPGVELGRRGKEALPLLMLDFLRRVVERERATREPGPESDLDDDLNVGDACSLRIANELPCLLPEAPGEKIVSAEFREEG